MKNNECKIIRDLLPNYVGDLTSEKTNEFIKSHLEQCEECSKIYEIMKEDVNPKITDNDILQINGLKKINKKFRIFKLTIIILLFVLLTISVSFSLYITKGYRKAVQNSIYLIDSLDNIDAFYATIEKIENSIFDDAVFLTIRGLNVNTQDHQGKYKILVSENSQKIIWQEKDLKISDFKVGQNILVISIGEPIPNKHEENTQILKIQILDNNL